MNRPAGLDRESLGFDRQQMVRWLSPTGLWHTAVKVFLSTVIGQYADKREIEAVIPAKYTDEFDYSDGDDLWVDYLADTGDGFDSTMSMALLAGAMSISVDGAEPLPRGRILVLGGDEVYPIASTKNYENRFIGPFTAAHPLEVDETKAPHLYALPGNHDWYDGLTAFLRVFAQQKWIGGWQTRQQRSYFAIRLRPHWWLWAIDNQFDTYIDRPQLDYFYDAATHLSPNDGVILCTSKPAWVGAASAENAEEFSPTDYFERKIIRPTGANVRLWVSGDAHHYARYDIHADGTRLVTSGGGGAFTSATHDLPESIQVPPEKSIDPGKTTPSRTATLGNRFPDAKTSRGIVRSVGRIPFLNGGFPLFLALAYLLLSSPLLVGTADPDGFRSTFDRALHSGVMWAETAVLAAILASFTKRKNKLIRFGLGIPHAVAHVAGALVATGLATNILQNWSGTARDAGNVALITTFGAVIGSIVFCLYLYIAHVATGIHANEIFSGQRIEGYKNFLRMKLTDDALTIYPIGLENPGRNWKAEPDKSPEEPWVSPAQPLQPRLIEEPFTVLRTPGPS